MSRIAKYPITLPAGIEVKVSGSTVSMKNSRGELRHDLPAEVRVVVESNQLRVSLAEGAPDTAWAQAGTARAILQNMVKGLAKGYERKLEIVGVGYKAQVQGKTLNLALGYSRPINYKIPDGVVIETPSQTEIVVKGVNKQQVGQIAAVIRRFRPPEPYKGKGVRYANETIIRKEAKKS
jgi:large subunit ribosomal protein L6